MCLVARSNPTRCINFVTPIPVAITTNKVGGWNSSNKIPHCKYVKRFVNVNSEPICARQIKLKKIMTMLLKQFVYMIRVFSVLENIPIDYFFQFLNLST